MVMVVGRWESGWLRCVVGLVCHCRSRCQVTSWWAFLEISWELKCLACPKESKECETRIQRLRGNCVRVRDCQHKSLWIFSEVIRSLRVLWRLQVPAANASCQDTWQSVTFRWREAMHGSESRLRVPVSFVFFVFVFVAKPFLILLFICGVISFTVMCRSFSNSQPNWQ